jgi:hypothetical protein
LPKLAIFPTPQPITPQERELAAYAGHRHSLELNPLPSALPAAREPGDTPIVIAAIQIPLIKSPNEGAN